MFPGHWITGGRVSLTVTVKVHWLLLPLRSVAVFVTVVTPTGKAKPLAGTLTRFVTPQLSVAVTLNVTLLVHIPGAVDTVISAGQPVTGGCVSRTVTVKVHWLRLPLLSCAVLVTVVTPTGKAKPLAGTLTTSGAAQLSVTVTLKVTLLVHAPGAASTVMFAGQPITGGWASWIMAVFEQLPAQPVESVTSTVSVNAPDGPALTTTDEWLGAPTMAPSPEIDHW